MIPKLFSFLSVPERNRARLLLVMILIMASIDMLGVASIFPFMSVLANPDLVKTNSMLNYAYIESQQIGINSIGEFLFFLGLVVFVLLISSLVFKSFTFFLQTKFALMMEYSIGKRLVECYLHQPYSWFLSRNSADLSKSILSEVSTVIHNGLVPLLTLIAQSAVALALVFLLFLVDSTLAIVVGFVMCLAYASIFVLFSRWLKVLGQARIKANQERYTSVSEAFGAAKAIKVAGLEDAYVQRFAKPAELYAKGHAVAALIAQLPRYVVEGIAFGGMLILILYLMNKSSDFAVALPVIALYAFSGYRLLPALQQIYTSVTQLRYVGAAVDALHTDFVSLQEVDISKKSNNHLQVKKFICLNNVSYRYPGAENPALNGIDLTIPARSIVGFVGATGSGKTTILDIILGLLEPVEGSLCIDGERITPENRRKWQRVIGYVPQHIYLADDTVTANIAFGVEPSNIDLSAVEHAARMANIHEFVINDLAQGYDTIVGERGVCLSGGQCQRIGIARALYRNPQLLILDEATSALDSLTEKAVMDAVNSLRNDITVIMVAHRLSTVKSCNKIFLLNRGELHDCGTYDELSANNELFASMTLIK